MTWAGRHALAGRGPGGSMAGWRGLGHQVLLLVPPGVLYFIVRALAADQEREAFENAGAIVSLQKSLGLDWEATLQQRVLDTQWIIDLMNWVYIYGHFPLLAVALIASFVLRRRHFLDLRNALVVSGLIGLVCFIVYPVAPPRLFAPDQFFDSLSELSASYRVLQNPEVTNQFAAIPSFHVGWNLLVAVTLWRASRLPALRALAVSLPVLMVCAVVLTANHWVIDIVAGAAVAAAGLAAAACFRRWLLPALAAHVEASLDGEPGGAHAPDAEVSEPSSPSLA